MLVTVAAGFIAPALPLRLLERGDTVLGVDNHDNYYDRTIEEARSAPQASRRNYTYPRIDLAGRLAINGCLETDALQRGHGLPPVQVVSVETETDHLMAETGHHAGHQ